MLFWRNRHEVGDEELNAFVDGELEESARRRVERHLESCAPCSEAVAGLRAVSRAMSELPAVRAPRSFALRRADVTPAPASAGTGLFGSVQPLLSGVAAIAIVAFVVLAGFDIGADSSQGDDSDAASIAGDAESLQLSDARRSEVGDGDAAPSVDDGVPAQDAGALGDDENVVGYESNFTSDDDEDEPAARGGAAPPEENTEDPQTRESGQAHAGDSIAPALADDGDGMGLRVAEIVAAAVAIAAGGSVLLIWWRRRATAG